MSRLNQPLLRVQHLSHSYVQRHALTNAKFTVSAFADVHLTVYPGTTLGIIGESGAGKSSLARCLALLESPRQGEIWFEGVNLLSLGRKTLLPIRRRIQMIFQDATSALNPRLTAGDIVAEPLLIQGHGTRAQRRLLALEALEEVGLSHQCEGKAAMEFSGGQRQRLAIARALILKPKLLVLDEALSNLDIANQEMILNLLTRLQAEHSLTYIHISHDLRLVARFTDEVAVMREGRIVEQGKVAALFTEPTHAYTQELLAAMPSLESICEERFA